VDFLNSDTVQHLIGNYGYGAIFVIVMLESAGIPMPGETILVTATAYAATKHTLDIRWVIAAAAGGAILGDNIGFWVGREFGEPLLISRPQSGGPCGRGSGESRSGGWRSPTPGGRACAQRLSCSGRNATFSHRSHWNIWTRPGSVTRGIVKTNLIGPWQWSQTGDQVNEPAPACSSSGAI
jgi:hypothetical protein